MVTGYSESGFVFQGTNQVNLEFTIPKQSTEGFPHVELWIFPNKSLTPANKILDLSFLVHAIVPSAGNRRAAQPRVLWNTNEDCVYLNLTSLSKKILRVLQKKKLNESNVRLEVEVTYVEESNEKIENSTMNMARRDLCASLSQRNTNSSFLIIKNYDESSAPFVLPQSISNAVSKRDVSEVSIANASTGVTSPKCGVVPLVVDLTEVYGNFIKAPTVTDIKDCSGRCTLLLDRLTFTKHGEIKERLKLLPGGEGLSDYEPCCMPVEIKPLHVLIRLKDKSEVIVQIQDSVINKCACQ